MITTNKILKQAIFEFTILLKMFLSRNEFYSRALRVLDIFMQ